MNKNWRHIPCLTHTLYIVAQSGLDEIKQIHKKVKTVDEYFKLSTKSNIKLKKHTKINGVPRIEVNSRS